MNREDIKSEKVTFFFESQKTGQIKIYDSKIIKFSLQKLTAVYKILRTYLELQIDELDKSFENDMEISEDSNKMREVYNKRYLKKQGFMDRMRNKMDHDLAMFGYDKK